MPAEIPLPSSYATLIAWDLANPGALDRVVRFVNAMEKLDVAYIEPGTNNRARQSLLISESNAVLTLPLPPAS